jgi:hypothetical protein
VKKYESILKSKIYHNAKQRINLQGIMQENLGTINDVLSLSLSLSLYIYIYIYILVCQSHIILIPLTICLKAKLFAMQCL